MDIEEKSKEELCTQKLRIGSPKLRVTLLNKCRSEYTKAKYISYP